MKKFFKKSLLVLFAFCVALSFSACGAKISATTVSVENVKAVNGQTTNGGITTVYGEYLYFINGTKENDGKSSNNNKRSAICRIKYDVNTGKTSGDAEVVVDDLVGYKNGSINFFGDFLYYATPCADKNYKGDVLYNKVSFKRYDLVNKSSHVLYTTQQNDSEESVKYAYYVVGNSLNLLVYESSVKTLSSLLIDSNVKTNYVISDVQECLFSENYGVCTNGETVDANSFVYYSKSPAEYDYYQTGSKIYKVAPNTNNSQLISQGKSITLKAIKAGNLLFEYNSSVYAQTITSSTTEMLVTDNLNCISRAVLENAIYLENYTLNDKDATAKLAKSQGNLCVLYFDSDNKYFVIFEWKRTGSPVEDNSTIISYVDSATSFSFIGLTTLEEIVTEDDEATEENEEVKRNVLFAIFSESSYVYKIEIAEVVDANNLNVTQYSERVKMSTTKISDASGLLVPEVVGNYAFVIAKESEDDDAKEYLYQVDLTPTENVTKEATKISIDEE